MEQDVFCKIVAGDIPSDVLIETDELIVLADIAPKAPVHHLVVPKKHIATINEAQESDAQLLGRMVLAAKEAAEKLGISEGYKLVFNVGEGGGQEIPHIHLHLLGGWK